MDTGKKSYGDIISKCWQDNAFKQRFLTDPKKVLAEYDIEVPAGLDVKVVENTDSVMFLTLPPKPTRDELSDKQLDAVSGGAGPNLAQMRPNPSPINKFTTVVIAHTHNGASTCSQGKECIPW